MGGIVVSHTVSVVNLPLAGKVTVRSALAQEANIRERLNPRSANRFRAYEKRLSTQIGDCALDEFGTEAVVTYFGDRLADGERQGKPVSKPALLREVCFLRSALHRAYRAGELSRDPLLWWPVIRLRSKRVQKRVSVSQAFK